MTSVSTIHMAKFCAVKISNNESKSKNFSCVEIQKSFVLYLTKFHMYIYIFSFSMSSLIHES